MRNKVNVKTKMDTLSTQPGGVDFVRWCMWRGGGALGFFVIIRFLADIYIMDCCLHSYHLLVDIYGMELISQCVNSIIIRYRKFGEISK